MMDRADAMLMHHRAGHCAVIDLVRCAADTTEAVQAALEMEDLCERLTYDEAVRVIVLAFDGVMHEQPSQDTSQINVEERHSLVKPVANLKQPVIAAIRGDATGLGLELALACDIRIAAEGARFGLPQICEGILPSEGGTQRLPRLIGYGRAMAMILTGASIDASEAYQTGLVNRIVASDDVMKTAEALARDMAEKSPLSLSYAKEALSSGRDLTLEQGLQMEMDLYLLLCTSRDRIEGITALREKRSPNFEGS